MPVRAAIYARSSTRSQAERQTTRYQVEACAAFALARGYDVVAELVDESVSGKVLMVERPAGNEVIELAAAGRCDVVLVFRFDRIARSSADLISTDRALRAGGANLLSVVESDSVANTEPLDFFGDFAERELVAISQRMTVGRDRVAREGRWMGGPPSLLATTRTYLDISSHRNATLGECPRRISRAPCLIVLPRVLRPSQKLDDSTLSACSPAVGTRGTM